MKITKAVFVKSIVKMKDHPGGERSEIAVAGKSNVGKSSLINYLCGQNKLAKTSGTPGKTRLVNFFLINDEFYLVDLPGYGYAQVSKMEQNSWADMIEDYLKNTRHLKAILILLDIRHMPGDHDKTMFDWAAQYGVPIICAATKADKIAKSKRFNQIKLIKQAIGFGEGFEIYPVSSQDKHGKEEIIRAIAQYI